jgi:hypothetical protein
VGIDTHGGNVFDEVKTASGEVLRRLLRT